MYVGKKRIIRPLEFLLLSLAWQRKTGHSYLLEIKANFPNLFKDNSQPQIQPRFPLAYHDGIKDRIKTGAEETTNIY